MYITPFTIMDVDMYDSKMNTGIQIICQKAKTLK